jgi:hypothetical protein
LLIFQAGLKQFFFPMSRFQRIQINPSMRIGEMGFIEGGLSHSLYTNKYDCFHIFLSWGTTNMRLKRRGCPKNQNNRFMAASPFTRPFYAFQNTLENQCAFFAH